MPFTTTIQVDGPRRVVANIDVNGGVDDTDAVLIDVSTLSGFTRSMKTFTCNKLQVTKIQWTGGVVTAAQTPVVITLEYDRTVDVHIADVVLDGNSGHFHYEHFGGIKDTGTGNTGDVVATTQNLIAGSEGQLVIEAVKLDT